MVVLKPGLLNVFIALGLVYWLRMARIVRAQVLGLKELEFVLAPGTRRQPASPDLRPSAAQQPGADHCYADSVNP